MLLATALIVSWPILWGGYFTYADNPAHLAEIYSLAFDKGNGWSDVAFCGFPIGTLHSPLWYGALAALVRAGVSAGFLYALALFLGFVAPSIALYFVARRSLTPFSSAFIAYVFLIQWPSVVGLGSPLAGMWTYFGATALVVLLVWRLAHGIRSRRDLVWLAGLVGLIAITHLFPLVPLAVLGGVHLVRSVIKRSSLRSLLVQVVGVIVGVAAAAAYWLPMALASESTTFTPQNLTPSMALARLVFPTDVVELVKGEGPSLNVRSIIGALPMWALVVGGLSGAFLWKRRKSEIALYAASSSIVLAILIVFVAPATNARVFGPVSWRLLDFVRVFLALGAIPVVGVLESRVPAILRARSAVVFAVMGVALAVWWGAPLRTETPRAISEEMTEVRGLWRWLGENRKDDWGRVYIQDTFMTPPLDAQLGGSHVLALTACETGVRQLGSYYGVVPYKTKVWTMGQVGLLYGLRVTGADSLDQLRQRMIMTNATHLVVADPVLGTRLQGAREFRFLTRVGRFSVFELTNSVSEWVVPIQGDAITNVEEVRTGVIDFRVSQNPQGATVLVKTSYHPFWRMIGPQKAQLDEGPSGLMQIKWLPPGDHDVSLLYRQPRWPIWVSLAGWVLVGCLAVLPLKRFS